jgi:hypothetical protein
MSIDADSMPPITVNYFLVLKAKSHAEKKVNESYKNNQ